MGAFCASLIVLGGAYAGEPVKSSYSPVVITEPFEETMARMKAARPEVMKRQMDLLNERYDLDNRPAKGVMMSGGKKPVQEGIRVKLPKGMTWEEIALMTPEEMREKDLWPIGFLPLPHPNHPEGGMVFPQFHIDEIKKQDFGSYSRRIKGRISGYVTLDATQKTSRKTSKNGDLFPSPSPLAMMPWNHTHSYQFETGERKCCKSMTCRSNLATRRS
jgi:cytochrome c peroxidase